MWKAVGAICEVLTLWRYWQLPELARTHLKSRIRNFEVNSYFLICLPAWLFIAYLSKVIIEWYLDVYKVRFSYYLIKFKYSEKATKIWRNFVWRYLVISKFQQIFVAFYLDYINFILAVLWQRTFKCMVVNSVMATIQCLPKFQST